MATKIKKQIKELTMYCTKNFIMYMYICKKLNTLIELMKTNNYIKNFSVYE